MKHIQVGRFNIYQNALSLSHGWQTLNSVYSIAGSTLSDYASSLENIDARISDYGGGHEEAGLSDSFD